MKTHSIIVIDLQSENDQNYTTEQISRISEQVGVDLKSLMDQNFIRVWIDKDTNQLIGALDAKLWTSKYSNENGRNYYKGLWVSPEYSYLTKKQKDNLITMSHNLKNIDLPIVLDMDNILDKITEHGIDSLHKFEKDFLDNLSNKLD